MDFVLPNFFYSYHVYCKGDCVGPELKLRCPLAKGETMVMEETVADETVEDLLQGEATPHAGLVHAAVTVSVTEGLDLARVIALAGTI